MAYEEKEARELVLKAGLELVEKGLIARTWGNISARISENEFVITPSGRDYDSLTPEDLVVVDLAGNYDGNIKPSSEKGVHADVYREREDVNFVIHTHQKNATAISILGRNIRLGDKISEKTKQIIGPKIVCAEYGLSSTEKLNVAVEAAMILNPETNHVLMKNHGPVCFGPSYETAFDVAFTLEALCGKIFEYYVDEKIATVPNMLFKVEIQDLVPEIAGDMMGEDGSDTQIIYENSEDSPLVIYHACTPYICKFADMGKTMKIYTDDLGQLNGRPVKCAPHGANFSRIEKIRGNDRVIFVKGNGAYCFGDSDSEAEAAALVLEKACQAAFLGLNNKVPALKPWITAYEHFKYVKGYSKLRNENT